MHSELRTTEVEKTERRTSIGRVAASGLNIDDRPHSELRTTEVEKTVREEQA
jgi:hypothetical protein